jgi:hypothetical protein
MHTILDKLYEAILHSNDLQFVFVERYLVTARRTALSPEQSPAPVRMPMPLKVFLRPRMAEVRKRCNSRNNDGDLYDD